MNEEIERLVNSDDPEDIVKVNLLKNEAQELENERDAAIAKKYFAKMQLAGEKPTKLSAILTRREWRKHSLKNLTL